MANVAGLRSPYLMVDRLVHFAFDDGLAPVAVQVWLRV